MIKSDLIKEIAVGRKEDTADQVKFEKAQRLEERAMEATIAARDEAKAESAELQIKITETEAAIDDEDEKFENGVKEADAIKLDCNWVKTTFETRRKDRKT